MSTKRGWMVIGSNVPAIMAIFIPHRRCDYWAVLLLGILTLVPWHLEAEPDSTNTTQAINTTDNMDLELLQALQADNSNQCQRLLKAGARLSSAQKFALINSIIDPICVGDISTSVRLARLFRSVFQDDLDSGRLLSGVVEIATNEKRRFQLLSEAARLESEGNKLISIARQNARYNGGFDPAFAQQVRDNAPPQAANGQDMLGKAVELKTQSKNISTSQSMVARLRREFSVEVTVVGLGSTYELAVRDAQRIAAEQALGLSVATQTIVDKDTVIKDTIKTTANGFFEKYALIDQQQVGKLYQVHIRAVVRLGQALAPSVEASQSIDYPSLPSRPDQSSPLQMIDVSNVVGKWIGANHIITLNSNMTASLQNQNGRDLQWRSQGTWVIKGTTVIITWDNGCWDKLFDPFNGRTTRVLGCHGTRYSVTKMVD